MSFRVLFVILCGLILVVPTNAFLNSHPGVDRNVTRVTQEIKGLPVFGGNLNIQTDTRGNILFVSGKTTSNRFVNEKTVVDNRTASEIALRIVSSEYGKNVSDFKVVELSKQVFNPSLLGIHDDTNYVCWVINVKSVNSLPEGKKIFIDTQTGKVLLSLDTVYSEEGLHRAIFDYGDYGFWINSWWRLEGQNETGIKDVDDAYTYSGDFYNYFNNNFNRRGMSNDSGSIILFTRYCDSYPFCPLQNAMWGYGIGFFGDNFTTADIVSHEMTHGLTENTSNLIYYGESGAINEAMSDIFGMFVKLTYNRTLMTNETKWLHGNDLPFGPTRSLKDPTEFGMPDRTGSDYYYCGDGDSGGVHYNSGVASKSAYLLTDGDNFNGYNISGIGMNRSAPLFYYTEVNLLTPASNYSDLGKSLVQASLDLDYSNLEREQVEKTVNATEMNLPTRCNRNETTTSTTTSTSSTSTSTELSTTSTTSTTTESTTTTSSSSTTITVETTSTTQQTTTTTTTTTTGESTTVPCEVQEVPCPCAMGNSSVMCMSLCYKEVCSNESNTTTTVWSTTTLESTPTTSTPLTTVTTTSTIVTTTLCQSDLDCGNSTYLEGNKYCENNTLYKNLDVTLHQCQQGICQSIVLPEYKVVSGICLNSDINHDGKVNYSDLLILARGYNKKEGDIGYNPSTDLNGDKKTDNLDLLVLVRDYGKSI